MTDANEIDNWTTGLLQVFFEGSWSQVCATGFDAPDANVACRQLGFGAGAIVPKALSTVQLDELRRTNIYPEIAITGASCMGTEEKLVDCGVDSNGTVEHTTRLEVSGRDCLNSEGDGLVVGCVAAPLQSPSAGASPHLMNPRMSKIQRVPCSRDTSLMESHLGKLLVKTCATHDHPGA